MKNKTGIVTIQKVKNYGAALQAFALQTALFSLNFDNDIIDFKREIKKIKKTKDKYGILGVLIVRLIENLKQFRRYLLNVISFRDFSLNKLNQKNKLFDSFDTKYLCYSKNIYSESNLSTTNDIYSSFVCGSDQVWNHNFAFSIEAYFLKFVDKANKKIAFAPSFGIEEVPSKFYDEYRTSFNNFNSLSVREAEGVKIIKEITGNQIPVLLDPIFLLSKEEWLQKFSIERKETKKPYILCYTLGSEDKIALEICREIAAEKKYDIVRLGRGKEDVALKNVIVKWNVGPIEFLDLINNSVLVVTNSFHGTAFSINFNIPFFCVLSKENNRTSRIANILRIFSLENRIVYEYAKHIQDDLQFADVQSLQETIVTERQKSVNFLKKALN